MFSNYCSEIRPDRRWPRHVRVRVCVCVRMYVLTDGACATPSDVV